MGFAPENESGGAPKQDENWGTGILIVAILAACKRLEPQIQNINKLLHIESLWEILFALSEYNGIEIKDIKSNVFPILTPFLCEDVISSQVMTKLCCDKPTQVCNKTYFLIF